MGLGEPFVKTEQLFRASANWDHSKALRLAGPAPKNVSTFPGAGKSVVRYTPSVASIIHAWDDVWNAVEEAGIRKAYDDPHGPYLPIGDNGVAYGQMIVDRLEELRAGRLTAAQIHSLAALIRALAKAVVIG